MKNIAKLGLPTLAVCAVLAATAAPANAAVHVGIGIGVPEPAVVYGGPCRGPWGRPRPCYGPGFYGPVYWEGRPYRYGYHDGWGWHHGWYHRRW